MNGLDAPWQQNWSNIFTNDKCMVTYILKKKKSKNENDKKKRLSKYYDSEIFFFENFPGLSC